MKNYPINENKTLLIMGKNEKVIKIHNEKKIRKRGRASQASKLGHHYSTVCHHDENYSSE